MYQPTDILHAPDEIRAILGEEFENQTLKIIDHIDAHCRDWIARCPFVAIATSNAKGEIDISPKGDPAGFVTVLDDKTLAIPDRIGNHRGDTFLNILDNPRIGLMFVIPKRREVVRVSGSAQVVRDPGLLDAMVVNGHRPDLAILVRVEEAFFHCGKAMIRGRMWEPEKWQPVEGLPSYAQALKDHGQLTRTLADLEAMTADNETDRLY